MDEGCKLTDFKSREQLYKFFYPAMIKICLRYAPDADGAGTIYNNAMLKVFKATNSYKEEGKLSAWVKTIVVNCCIDFCKAKNIFKNITDAFPANDVFIEPEVFNHVSAKEIKSVIRKLPDATATVFMLFLYEGLTHRQIAGHLDISENTSKWHVREAKARLKKIFENTSAYKSISDAIK